MNTQLTQQRASNLFNMIVRYLPEGEPENFNVLMQSFLHSICDEGTGLSASGKGDGHYCFHIVFAGEEQKITIAPTANEIQPWTKDVIGKVKP